VSPNNGELSRIGIAAAVLKTEGHENGVGVRVPRSPPQLRAKDQVRYKNLMVLNMEIWQSGRMHTLGKRESPKAPEVRILVSPHKSRKPKTPL
jgi:hypothetical protein